MLFLLFAPVSLPFNPFLIAIVVLGITFDLIHSLINRIYNYLNPYKVAEMFTEHAETASCKCVKLIYAILSNPFQKLV